MNNKNLVFLSYSRDDSDFVLRLAKQLKSDGNNVWLDQLDIGAGERWDLSIQNALRQADEVVIVLSKSSVSSDNVMDEVSYALEEDKKIIPLLIEECDVPFRLRRFQYVSFIDNYNAGYILLKQVINENDNNRPYIESKSIQASTSRKNEPKAETSKTFKNKTNETKSTFDNKLLLYILIPVILIAGLVGYFVMKKPAKPEVVETDLEKEYWEKIVLPSNKIATYNEYISQYPEGKYARDAQDSLTIIPTRVELNEWLDSKLKNTVAGFYSFAENYPESKYKDSATMYAEELQQWEVIESQNSAEQFFNFIVVNPDSKFKSKALENILAKDLTTGWIYSGKTAEGEVKSGRIFELVYSDEEFTSTKIPKAGDIVRNRVEARGTYSSYANGNTSGSSLGSIARDKFGYVEQVELNSNTLFLKIRFEK